MGLRDACVSGSLSWCVASLVSSILFRLPLYSFSQRAWVHWRSALYLLFLSVSSLFIYSTCLPCTLLVFPALALGFFKGMTDCGVTNMTRDVWHGFLLIFLFCVNALQCASVLIVLSQPVESFLLELPRLPLPFLLSSLLSVLSSILGVFFYMFDLYFPS